jgi:hypothetical protein
MTMRAWGTIGFMVLPLAVGACAGRMANPVEETAVYDRYMSCRQVQVEMLTNNERQADLVREKLWLLEKNDYARAGTIVFLPAIFAVDTTVEGEHGTPAQDDETYALTARNNRLGAMATDKGC